jgi:ribosomal protein S4
MRYKTRRLLAIGAVLAIVASGGAAFAAGAGATQAGAKTKGGGTLVGAVSSYLGITAKQLGVELATGKSLAQIATAHGKTVSGLEQTIESAVKARLDQAVAAGAITSQQEQKVLTQLHSRLDTLVGRAHPLAALRKGLKLGGLVHVATTYLGVTAQQLRTELEAGKTLAQVATEHGKTAAGLEQAITSAVKTRLDKAVAAGHLKAQTEQTILTRLGKRLDTLVNHSFTH